MVFESVTGADLPARDEASEPSAGLTSVTSTVEAQQSWSSLRLSHLPALSWGQSSSGLFSSTLLSGEMKVISGPWRKTLQQLLEGQGR
jgi:hypothetical protein